MFSYVIRKLQFCTFARSSALPEKQGNKTVSQVAPNKKEIGSGKHEAPGSELSKPLSLIAGPLLFALVMFVPVSAGFTYPMKALAASTLWIAVWWVTEAVSIPATSLLPLVLFPICGILPFEKTAVGYADNVVFLFMGGFMLAVSMQRWNLHRRIALTIVKYVGTNPARLILGFMVATGFLSMWISNTATAVMMMPVGLSVISQVSGTASDDPGDGKYGFGTTLMLGIAYSASIGGVATLIGSPPNAIFAAMAGSMYGVEITFTQWFLYGFPIAVVFLAVAWVYLISKTSLSPTGQQGRAKEVINEELKSLGPIGKAEKLVAAVFLLTAFAWIFRSLFLQKLMPFLSDSLIAMIAVLLMFIIPINLKKGEFLLDWNSAVKIPWGILLLFGGGIAIAKGFTETHLADWLGESLSFIQGAPLSATVLVIVALVMLLSNVTSNTGTISMMLPVVASLAVAMSIHPFGVMIAATTAVSFVFMLPVGTPPNAVVFGSGYVTIPQMARVGLVLTLLAIIVISLMVYFWLPLTWGIKLGAF